MKLSENPTKQEVFDFVVSAVLEQGKPAVNEQGNCRYRVQRGDRILKCAAGHLIPDDIYVKTMENQTFYTLMQNEVLGPQLRNAVPAFKYEDLITSLQGAHDNSFDNNNDVCDQEGFLSMFRHKASILAGKFGLQYNV